MRPSQSIADLLVACTHAHLWYARHGRISVCSSTHISYVAFTATTMLSVSNIPRSLCRHGRPIGSMPLKWPIGALASKQRKEKDIQKFYSTGAKGIIITIFSYSDHDRLHRCVRCSEDGSGSSGLSTRETLGGLKAWECLIRLGIIHAGT
jgi:hypothetical protein